MPWYHGPTPVQKEFSRRIARQWLIALPFAIGLLLLPMCLEVVHSARSGRLRADCVLTIYVIVPMEAILFGLALLNWRCPVCRRFLGKDSHPRVCASCGAELTRENHAAARNPFWTLLHLSFRTLRAAHDLIQGAAFTAFGACLGGIGGVWLAGHFAPKSITTLLIGGAVLGLVAGGLIARNTLRSR